MGFKMIQNNSVVEADLSPCYVKYHPRMKTFVRSSQKDAQFVMSRDGNQVWRLHGRDNNGFDDYEFVEMIETDDGEVAALIEALDANKEPIVIDAPIMEPPREEEPSDDTIALLKEHLISRMIQENDASICEGFTVKLKDRKKHHFALSLEDQMNIIALDSMRGVYGDAIPYQAIGEEPHMYSSADFDAIVKGAAECRASHYIYLKNLCAYVNTLETFEDLQGVFYGMNIPEKSQLLKVEVQK